MMINCYKDEYNLMMIMIKVVTIVVVFAPGGVMVDGSVVMLVMHSDGSVVAIV